jgi:DNA-binding Lrp family transcriptional regulator
MKFKRVNHNLEPEIAVVSERPKVVPPPPSHRPKDRAIHFILLKVQPGQMKRTMGYLRKVKGISGCHPVYGEYDLVILVRETKDVDKSTLIKRIWTIPNVVDVQTLVAAS